MSASRALLGHCRRIGLDTAQIIAAAGLPPALNHNADLPLALEGRLALWRAACAAARDPYLHLQVAEHAPFGSFRISDFVCATAPSVGTALRKLSHLFEPSELGMKLTYVEDTERVHLLLENSGGDETARAQRTEHFFAVCYLRARLATGVDFRPQRLELEAGAPPDAGPVERAFRCPVQFGAARNRLWFCRRDMEQPNEHDDAELLELLEASIATPDSAAGAANRLRLALEHVVMQEMRDAPAIRRVARKLGMSSRTLQRRLRACGTSFSDVVEEARQRRACRMLAQRQCTILKVAEELGFSEQSAFTRALKRWTGFNPTQLRCLLRAS